MDEPTQEINTANEFLLGLKGSKAAHAQDNGPCVRTTGIMPYFNTRQRAYRFAAWLVSMAEMLPDEPGQPTDFGTILKAVQNT